jgi:hypothetical protein
VIVSRVRVAVAVCAVLLWAVTPVLACLVPCLTSTSDKQECPHHMALHCGHSMITAGRTCCQLSSHPQMATVEMQVRQPQKRVLDAVPFVGYVSLTDMTTRSASLGFSGSPPNEAPPPSSSVLRI